MVGTRLLHRWRDGVRLTEAGSVLLEESRTVLALLEHAMSLSRQAAGLGRLRLSFALPPNLPERLAVSTASPEALPDRLEVMALGDFEPERHLRPLTV
jgi:DNA-binding transcriptional LysR family regulator